MFAHDYMDHPANKPECSKLWDAYSLLQRRIRFPLFAVQTLEERETLRACGRYFSGTDYNKVARQDEYFLCHAVEKFAPDNVTMWGILHKIEDALRANTLADSLMSKETGEFLEIEYLNYDKNGDLIENLTGRVRDMSRTDACIAQLHDETDEILENILQWKQFTYGKNGAVMYDMYDSQIMTLLRVMWIDELLTQ